MPLNKEPKANQTNHQAKCSVNLKDMGSNLRHMGGNLRDMGGNLKDMGGNLYN